MPNSYSTLSIYINVLHVPVVLGLLSSAGLKPALVPVLKEQDGLPHDGASLKCTVSQCR